MTEDYSKFVDHPRFGQQPKITGLNPDDDYFAGIHLHWHSPADCRIPNTAISANMSLQTPATIQVTHYFDVKRKCRDCGRPFIFFAAEQKYWYEDLGFGLDSDCVRCVPCRNTQQDISQTQQRYESLFHISERTFDQNLEMADCCLLLIEADIFHSRKLQFVRMLLKNNLVDINKNAAVKVNDLRERLRLLETKNNS
jgi:Probable zinc-ribbon domain